MVSYNSSQAAEGTYWFPVEAGEFLGSSPRLLECRCAKSIVDVGGKFLLSSSLGILLGMSRIFLASCGEA